MSTANQTSVTAFPGLDATVRISLRNIQSSNVNAAFFGALFLWGLFVVSGAFSLARDKQYKPLYLLNLFQAAFMLIKTVSAMVYAIFPGLICDPRPYLMTIPLTISLDLIYAILVLKLLLFTPYKRFCQVVFALAIATHMIMVIVAVVDNTGTVSSSFMCGNRYPLLFKMQYIVEIILEVFIAVMLIHGLVYKQGNLFEGTRDIFRQIRENDHIRLFLVMIIITLKIISAYVSIPNFDSTGLTHTLDSSRSAIVQWALDRERRKVAQTVAEHSRRPSTNPMSKSHSTSINGSKIGSRQGSVQFAPLVFSGRSRSTSMQTRDLESGQFHSNMRLAPSQSRLPSALVEEDSEDNMSSCSRLNKENYSKDAVVSNETVHDPGAAPVFTRSSEL